MRKIARHTPWLSFATGNWWELTPGEDHDQGSRMALNAAKAWAKAHGYVVEHRLPAARLGDQVPWRIKLTKIGEIDGA
jgi:hypothetical protein